MNPLRAPVVAGVSGGVGTTTLAVALRGHDAGRAAAGADILACRGTADSLRRAALVLDDAGPGPRPVVAVTLVGGVRPTGPVRVRLQPLEREAAVVVLPQVDRWRLLPNPFVEIVCLLVVPPSALPRPLHRYAHALRELAAAVAGSGRLHPTPPARSIPPPPARVPHLDRPSSPSRQPRTQAARRSPDAGLSPEPRYGGAPAANRAAPAANGASPSPAAPRIVASFRPAVGAGPAAVGRQEPPSTRGVRIVAPPRTAPLPDPTDSGAPAAPASDVAAPPAAPAARVEQVG